MAGKFSIAIHGGAFIDDKDFTPQTEFLKKTLEESADILKDGGSALDAVTKAVILMEDSGLYIAGKGSGPNEAGYFELDASIMDSASGKAGAVASLRSFKNPILAARAVMEKSRQVFYVGEGAEKFAHAQDLETVDKSYFVPIHKESQVEKEKSHGTVGAVALDQSGNLAAATSTGGLTGKPEGRVGDCPIIGAGTFADQNVAVSATGYGEYFMRTVAAHDIAARMEYGGESLESAVGQTMDKIQKAGGWGGLIAVNKDGMVKLGYGPGGMHRGYTDQTGEIFAASKPGA